MWIRSRKRYERELVKLLRDMGLVAFKLPSSGSNDELALDVVAWDPKTKDLYVFEVKTSKKDIDDAGILNYLSKNELEKIEKLKMKGVKVMIAVRTMRTKKRWKMIET